MVDVLECTVSLAPNNGAPRRAFDALLRVANTSNQSFTAAVLRLQFVTPEGHLAAVVQLEGGPILPGEQVLAFDGFVGREPIGGVHGELSYMLGRWVSTVRDVRPGHAPVTQAAGGDGPTEDTGSDVIAPPSASTTALSVPAAVSESPAKPSPVNPAPIPGPIDPWALLAEGDEAGARRHFETHPMQQSDRDQVRVLLRSGDPAEVALGCRVSRWGRWSIPLSMRRLLDHPTPTVRLEAVVALGASAGPSLLNSVQPLCDDPDEQVRNAAKQALRRMRGEESRNG